MIIAFLGERGSGKTLTMVKEAYRKYLLGYTIYSNIHLNFPYTPYNIDTLLNFAESGEYFDKCLVIIDEVHILFDSRCSGKKRNRIFSYLLNQSSKMDMDIWFTSQYIAQCEIRLRRNVEIAIYCNAKCIVYRNKNSIPVILPNYRPKQSDYKVITFIKNTIIKFNSDGTEDIKTLKFKAKQYFKLYNTKEVVKVSEDKYEIQPKETRKEKIEKQKWNVNIQKDLFCEVDE